MPLTFTYEGATQEIPWEHMNDVSTTSFHNSTNLQDCQDFLILHIHIGEINHTRGGNIPYHSNIIPHHGMAISCHTIHTIPYHSYHTIANTTPYHIPHCGTAISYHTIQTIPYHTIYTTPLKLPYHTQRLPYHIDNIEIYSGARKKCAPHMPNLLITSWSGD